MIQHVSITAGHPKHAAETIAIILGGRALPIGPTEGTWTAFGPDPVGNFVEVLPRGSEFHRTGDRLETRQGPCVRHSGFHVMLETPLSEEEVMDVAKDRGAAASRAKHGPFELLEFWIEDCLLIELLTPELGRAYRQFLRSPKKRNGFLSRFGLDA